MNPGDNSVFLDLMYATWPAGSEEKRELDTVAGLMDQGSLSVEARSRIAAYSMRDPGDEDDQARVGLDEIERRFGHTFITRPSWWPKTTTEED